MESLGLVHRRGTFIRCVYNCNQRGGFGDNEDAKKCVRGTLRYQSGHCGKLLRGGDHVQGGK